MDMALAKLPLGEIIAENISAEDYMDYYAEQHCEWVRGYVIKMPPISFRHYRIVDYLEDLLKAYFTLNPIGRLVGEPFVMRIDATGSRCEPELDAQETYQTPLLPRFRLHVPTLWQEELPDIFAITAAVRTMVEQKEQE